MLSGPPNGRARGAFAPAEPGNTARVAYRWMALFCWSWATWTLLSWTLSAEQVGFGAGLAALTALVCAPLGPVGGPWTFLRPRRAAGVLLLGGLTLARVIVANVRLSRRIWSPAASWWPNDRWPSDGQPSDRRNEPSPGPTASPHRDKPASALRSGMVIVPTTARGDGALTTVAVLTSLIVDSQLIDLDRRRHELQYHVVYLEHASARDNRRAINASVERLLAGPARR